jgi:predicted regulator of Ras-like GTPase activity (Roadblock/LC7/MglB family)
MMVWPAQAHDLAALAAATVGIGRQTGISLRHGNFTDATIHSHRGYFTVYVIGEAALLAVVGDQGMNVARLHLEARAVTQRLAALLNAEPLARRQLTL